MASSQILIMQVHSSIIFRLEKQQRSDVQLSERLASPASWGPIWAPPWNPSDHHSTLVLRGLRRALHWPRLYRGPLVSLTHNVSFTRPTIIHYIYIYIYYYCTCSMNTLISNIQMFLYWKNSKRYIGTYFYTNSLISNFSQKTTQTYAINCITTVTIWNRHYTQRNGYLFLFE